MYLHPIISSLLALSFTSLVSPSPFLEERTYGCSRDNLQCCFEDNRGPASSYCSSVAGGTYTTTVKTVTPTTTVITTITSTSVSISGTTTKTITSTSTALTTTTQILAVTVVSTLTTTITQISTTTLPSTVIVATVTVAPPGVPKKQKRDAQGPTCLTKTKGTSTSYSPSQVTSACSCIGISRCTLSTTATAPTSTITSTRTTTTVKTTPSTVTVTTTTTVSSTSTYAPTSTITSISTVPITITSVTTTTLTLPSTSTVTSAPPTCNTDRVAPVSRPNLFYIKNYQTVGFRETDANPGNDVPDEYPPIQTTFPGALPLCQAVQACLEYAFNNPESSYASFVLYKLTAENQYECRAYFNVNDNPAPFFTIADPNVATAYAYTFENA